VDLYLRKGDELHHGRAHRTVTVEPRLWDLHPGYLTPEVKDSWPKGEQTWGKYGYRIEPAEHYIPETIRGTGQVATLDDEMV